MDIYIYISHTYYFHYSIIVLIAAHINLVSVLSYYRMDMALFCTAFWAFVYFILWFDVTSAHDSMPYGQMCVYILFFFVYPENILR